MLDPDLQSDNEAYMGERTIISAMYGVSPASSRAKKSSSTTLIMLG
jgi:hypothetical protein